MPTNLIEINNRLRGMPDQWLQQEAQQPSGIAPPYLVLAEMGRRQQLRSQAQGAPPQSTVYEDLVGIGASSPMATMDQLRPQMPLQGQQPMQAALPAGPPAPSPPVAQPAGLPGLLAQRPQRYSRGGVVRMKTGGWFPFLEEDDDSEYTYRHPFLTAAPITAPAPSSLGSVGVAYPIIRRGGQEFLTPKYPEYKPPDLPEVRRFEVKEPVLADVLKQVRGMRGYDPTDTIEARIQDLARSRQRIEHPNFSQALFETGLGILASRAPHTSMALGEAGSRALANYQARAENARRQEMALDEKLAELGIRSATERSRMEQSDLDNAMRLQQQMHGTAVTNAQLGQQADISAYNRAVALANAQRQADIGQYEASRDLFKEILPPKPTYAQTPQGRKEELEDKKALLDWEWEHRKEYAKIAYGEGSGRYRPLALNEAQTQDAAIRTLYEQINLPGRDLSIKSWNLPPYPKPDDKSEAADRIRQDYNNAAELVVRQSFDDARKNLANPDNYINHPLYRHGVNREFVTDEMWRMLGDKKMLPILRNKVLERFRSQTEGASPGSPGGAPISGPPADVPVLPDLNKPRTEGATKEYDPFKGFVKPSVPAPSSAVPAKPSTSGAIPWPMTTRPAPNVPTVAPVPTAAGQSWLERMRQSPLGRGVSANELRWSPTDVSALAEANQPSPEAAMPAMTTADWLVFLNSLSPAERERAERERQYRGYAR